MADKKPGKRKPAARTGKSSARPQAKPARAGKPRRKSAAKPARRPRPRPFAPPPLPSTEELQSLGDSITERAVEHFGGEAEPGSGAAPPAPSRSVPDDGSS